jgi:glycerate 2-kinase
MRVLLAPDKFKGTLDAASVARALARGWLKARPNDELRCLPISDGGDGFGHLLGKILGGQPKSTLTVNAAHQPRRSQWWWVSSTRLAILEAAQSNGLAILPPGRFHPFHLDTFGIGKLLLAPTRLQAEHLLIGVGGSATNDGGFGFARSLGWKFLRRNHSEIQSWTDLRALASLTPPKYPPLPSHLQLSVATDVEVPLLGPQGATRLFGPQKGLQPEELSAAENCLRRLAQVVEDQLGFSQLTPGSGAAGGLGFGLMAFSGARPTSGFHTFAHHAQLPDHVDWADVVITGEGSFDRSSLIGKGTGKLIELTALHQKPCLVIAGRLDLPPNQWPPRLQATSLLDSLGESQALNAPRHALYHVARLSAQQWTRSNPDLH